MAVDLGIRVETLSDRCCLAARITWQYRTYVDTRFGETCVIAIYIQQQRLEGFAERENILKLTSPSRNAECIRVFSQRSHIP